MLVYYITILIRQFIIKSMPNINCSYCKSIIHNCGHSITQNIFLVVCQGCKDRDEFLPQTMARFFLIQRSVYNQECTRRKQTQQTIKQLKLQGNLIQQGVLDSLINNKTKELALKFSKFRDEVQQKEELIREDLKQAIDKIMKETESSIRGLVASQVGKMMSLIEQIQDSNAEGERELAQAKEEVMRFVQSKRYITSQQEEAASPALISPFKLKELVTFFNERANQFIQKKDILVRLMQEGQDVINFATTQQRQLL